MPGSERCDGFPATLLRLARRAHRASGAAGDLVAATADAAAPAGRSVSAAAHSGTRAQERRNAASKPVVADLAAPVDGSSDHLCAGRACAQPTRDGDDQRQRPCHRHGQWLGKRARLGCARCHRRAADWRRQRCRATRCPRLHGRAQQRRDRPLRRGNRARASCRGKAPARAGQPRRDLCAGCAGS